MNLNNQIIAILEYVEHHYRNNIKPGMTVDIVLKKDQQGRRDISFEKKFQKKLLIRKCFFL